MCSTKGYDICLHCDEPLAIEKGPAVKYGSNSYDMPSRIRRHMNKPELTEGSDYVTYYNVNVQDPYTGGGAVAKTFEDEIADGDLTAGVPTMWMDAGAELRSFERVVWTYG